MSIITLTTDFGNGSPYAAAMKGVILSINPAVTLVDITHDIPPQDIRHAAVVLNDVADRFPDDSIHVAVVDPGVGTGRSIVFARFGRQNFVAPDNGLFGALTEQCQPSRLVRLTNEAFWLDDVSATFHGRDIMAPVAAHLSLGVDPELLGPPHESLVKLDWPEVRLGPSVIEGTIRMIDSFGNLVTNITSEMLLDRPTDIRARIDVADHETWGIFRTYGDHPEGSFIALVGSSNHLELAVVGSSAARLLAVSVGDHVRISWE